MTDNIFKGVETQIFNAQASLNEDKIDETLQFLIDAIKELCDLGKE